MGRPKKQTDEVRTNVLRIRLTADERRAIDEAARSRSLDTSAWVRSELLLLAARLAAQGQEPKPARRNTATDGK